MNMIYRDSGIYSNGKSDHQGTQRLFLTAEIGPLSMGRSGSGGLLKFRKAFG